MGANHCASITECESRCFICGVLGRIPGMRRLVRWHLHRMATRLPG